MDAPHATVIAIAQLLNDPLWQLSLAAGLLMVIGYAVYIYLDIKHEHIDPNPLTWLMFAYGTVLLTVLEYSLGSDWRVLVVPLICSFGGVLVFARCARKYSISRARFKELFKNRWDKLSLVSDLLITAGYTVLWALVMVDILSVVWAFWATVAFLFLSNASTVPQFIPMYQDVLADPKKEHWLPWAIWSASYAILWWLTLVDPATSGEGVVLLYSYLFYPVSNVFLHAAVGVLVLWNRGAQNAPAPSVVAVE